MIPLLSRSQIKEEKEKKMKQKENNDTNLPTNKQKEKKANNYIPYSLIPRIEEPYPDITFLKYGEKYFIFNYI